MSKVSITKRPVKIEDLSKPIWKSKTLWAALVCVALTVCPPTSLWIASNPTIWAALTSALFGGLRFVTKEKVRVK